MYKNLRIVPREATPLTAVLFDTAACTFCYTASSFRYPARRFVCRPPAISMTLLHDLTGSSRHRRAPANAPARHVYVVRTLPHRPSVHPLSQVHEGRVSTVQAEESRAPPPLAPLASPHAAPEGGDLQELLSSGHSVRGVQAASALLELPNPGEARETPGEGEGGAAAGEFEATAPVGRRRRAHHRRAAAAALCLLEAGAQARAWCVSPPILVRFPPYFCISNLY